MGLSKEQGYRINHSDRHIKGGADPIKITDLYGVSTGALQTVLIDASGSVIAKPSIPPYISTGVILTALEDESNWSSATYTSTGGIQGQRAVSSDKHFFYECIEDKVWVRYTIALSHFNMYLESTGNDAVVRTALENSANWEYAEYIGTPITHTYQGQAHVDRLYKYEAVSDNIWIRTPRQ